MNLKLLIICMALVRSGDGQSQYPLLSISATGDTLCTITLPQLQRINIKLVGLDQCGELSDSIQSALYTCEDLAKQRKDVIDKYATLVSLQDSIIGNHIQMVNAKDEIITGLEIKNNENRVYQRKLRHTILGWKISFGLFVAGTVAALIAF